MRCFGDFCFVSEVIRHI